MGYAAKPYKCIASFGFSGHGIIFKKCNIFKLLIIFTFILEASKGTARIDCVALLNSAHLL
jgi:hypothetical protein